MRSTDRRSSFGVVGVVGSFRLLIIALTCSLSMKSAVAFSPKSMPLKIGRARTCHGDKLSNFRATTILSATPNDFISTSIYLSAQLEAYEKQGVPSIVLPIIVSLIVGTILLPLTARKFQKDRNTRSLKDKGMQQEPEDAAGAYEKFYKLNAKEEKDKI